MSEWQKGDVALCLFRGPWRGNKTGRQYPGVKPQFGYFYTVASVKGIAGSTWLNLAELPACPLPFNASRFRKIEPHTPDEEDHETIPLMRDMEQPVADGWWAV